MNYFPIRFSYIFLRVTLFVKDSVLNVDLIDLVLNYIPCNEADILRHNLKEFDEETDDLIEFLSSNNCFSLPANDNVENITIHLAHKEFLQKPRYFSNSWMNVFSTLSLPKNFTSPYKL